MTRTSDTHGHRRKPWKDPYTHTHGHRHIWPVAFGHEHKHQHPDTHHHSLDPMRAMYARLAAQYRARPTVPDRGGGVEGDRYP